MKKSGVPTPVITAVNAWATSKTPPASLADARRTLDPLLVPQLVEEIAEITAEQLLIALDMPSRAPPAAKGEVQDGPEIDFLGLKLSQTQGRRVALWLDEQTETAAALGLTPEAWSKKLSNGFAIAIADLKGQGGTARAVAERLGADPLAQASKGFEGGADPRTSEKAGLRGMLAARSFKKP